MKTAPIQAGRLAFTADGLPTAPDYGDVYHPEAGALLQARHVFLAGNRLPARWAGRDRFVILETGFGLGNNFLATWEAWRNDPQRCERLLFVSIEKHPLTRVDLARAHAASPLPGLAASLLAAWPLATPNFHPLTFEDGRVQLLLGHGDLALLLPQLVAAVDAFFLDGFAPSRNPDMWDLRRLGRLAAPGATAATWSVARVVREGLGAAGFTVDTAAGTGGKRDITVARYTPRHEAAPPPGGWHAHAGQREALIIGAGLAGCATAWALGLQGWTCRLLDREAAPASATSGNPAGLFHGSFHRDDGPHARVLRAAALLTARIAGPWIAAGRIAGGLDGCLRLETKLDEAAARDALATQSLPADYVDWRSRRDAGALAGLALPHGAWFYPGGGWLAPPDYAGALMQASGAGFTARAEVARVARRGSLWQALDRDGCVIDEAPVVVLANGLEARRLLGSTLAPLSSVRGQISSLDAAAPGLPQPRIPVAGSGYVLPAVSGRLIFGASSDEEDDAPALREADHHANLAQLAGLSGLTSHSAQDWAALNWSGRVGWRAVTRDRLPLIGAVPDLAALDALATGARADHPRFVPRQRDADGGLYVCTGLGSRGIGWAALGGQLLASWISGAPCPLEADLRDALDPARFVVRGRG